MGGNTIYKKRTQNNYDTLFFSQVLEVVIVETQLQNHKTENPRIGLSTVDS
jgi:hypothetical protein